MKWFSYGLFGGERGNVRGISLIVAFCVAGTFFAPGVSRANLAAMDGVANAQCYYAGSPCASALGAIGICLGPNVCAATAVVSLGALLLSAAMGGSGGSSGGGVPAGGIPLTGQTRAGCSGTPYISPTPTSDPCGVYISTASAGNVYTNNAVSSSLLNGASSASTNVGATSSVSNTLLNTALTVAGATTASSAGTVSQNNSSAGTSGTSNSNAINSWLNYGQGATNNTSSSNLSSSLLSNNGTGASTSTTGIPSRPSGVQPSTWGDILASGFGVTIITGGHSADGRTGIAGFYGYDAVYSVQPKVLARQMCAARPWANLSTTPIIPLSFFDSVCDERGYNATTTPSMTTVITSAVGANKKSGTDVSATSTASTSTTSTTGTASSLDTGLVRAFPAPRIDIYAMPPRVRIGSRTTIYWSAKNVISCVESSPDGSFNGDTTSGAASTVALYENSAFTITCQKPDGSDVTKSVIVETSG